METTVGVTGKALARFGTSCYMNPLSTKMDDNTQLEVGQNTAWLLNEL